MDVVHPSNVSPSDYTRQCAWIRQVVEEQSVCLPVATVVIEGPFGKLTTEAAVSEKLPEFYPYLFSNKSDMLLREKGILFGDRVVQALTHSKVRKLATRLSSESNIIDQAHDVTVVQTEEDNSGNRGSEAQEIGQPEEESREYALLLPASDRFTLLLNGNRGSLATEQLEEDTAIQEIREHVESEAFVGLEGETVSKDGTCEEEAGASSSNGLSKEL
ncbi:hypothetical protein HPB51_025189 [Rhipicephalus microplus]|uniref:Uncharacterized protein n=1 Tax=Rhipicephalus microplus TaxID=6941 RepID=A0A9J6E4L6_RHIMP|nr:hypothetical protein HPB51_025189 [Rhipicephalus microplus]